MVEKMPYVSSKNLIHASIPDAKVDPIKFCNQRCCYKNKLQLWWYIWYYVIYITFEYFYCSSELVDAVSEDCEQVIDSEGTNYDIVYIDVSELVVNLLKQIYQSENC